MAVAILRPVADETLKHSCSSGSSGYILINEDSADGDSTYIYHEAKKNSIAYLDSEFRLSSPSKKKIKINSYKVYISACRTGTKDATARASLKYYNPKGEVLYGRVNDVTTQYSVCEYNIGVWKNVIIDSFEDSYAAHIIIYSTAIKNNDKDDNFQVRITQVYAVLDYEEISDPETGTGIFLKSNGSWEEVKSVYKKVDGTWVQQEDPKSLFSG